MADLPHPVPYGVAPIPAAGRPTGSVTFLFTDVAGSTALWEQYPAWMAVAHARYAQILAAAIAAQNGWAYKQIGDAFQAAFQTAESALAAAVAAQQALVAELWGEGSDDGRRTSGQRSAVSGPPSSLSGTDTADGDEPDPRFPPPDPATSDPSSSEPRSRTLRVRMALHSGTTEERPDDYVGPLLNRVARLLAASYGGQVLITAATYALVHDHLPSGVALHDLGARRLKDLPRAEHVYQALAPGLPAEFPPLRTPDNRPTNLPRPATAPPGRARDLTTIGALLRRPDVCLVTLTGPGDRGKTPLAVQTAVDLLDEFAGGVWFVDLTPLADPALVPGAIADVLAIPVPPERDPAGPLLAALRDKQLLLVLDHFEPVIDAADLVADILRAAPQVKLLITSREALDVYGEIVFPVLPGQ